MGDNAKKEVMEVSYRALLVGLLMAALLGFAAPYENLVVSGSPLHLDYSAPAAVGARSRPCSGWRQPR